MKRIEMVSVAKQCNYQIHPLEERIHLEMGGIPYPPQKPLLRWFT